MTALERAPTDLTSFQKQLLGILPFSSLCSQGEVLPTYYPHIPIKINGYVCMPMWALRQKRGHPPPASDPTETSATPAD